MSKLPATVLADLLNIRFADATLEEVLGQYVRIAKAGVPGVDEASITLIRQNRPFTAGYTGDLALAADELQYERGYGPCIDAGTSGTELVIPDMREETRWPDYSAVVVERGVLSSLSIPLPVQTELVGGLNLYARKPGAMGPESLEAAREVAAHIAVAIGNVVSYQDSAKLAADMQAAMASRAVIEQAKGAIMAQNRCTADEAFEILRVASMGRNVKLRDLATDIVERLQAPSA
ncbi:GAF and ANTAR domain-containing protein [Kineosporia rhizophila]|uniref:GAF and ANTAR domain-containing protein n=1 Tax=Kineosporia TaxID=49184 RepID=UPI000A8B11CE|nr:MULTISPECIES: GAF and ANTAR domain-containing protein [Kineosporia]MCE0534596.1 GAF and ANTAR domain-containing protein [Kineosporia rhizophila]GLY15615.1 transcription antitermination regulator [Kineosporia sp. NBRC 101677]